MKLYLNLPLSMHKAALARGAEYNPASRRFYVTNLEAARNLVSWMDHWAMLRIREKGGLEPLFATARPNRVVHPPKSPAPKRGQRKSKRPRRHLFFLSVPEADYNQVARLGAHWHPKYHKFCIRAETFPERFLPWQAESFGKRLREARAKHEAAQSA